MLEGTQTGTTTSGKESGKVEHTPTLWPSNSCRVLWRLIFLESQLERERETHTETESLPSGSFPLVAALGWAIFFYCFSETISRELDRKWNQRHSISANMGCWLYLLLHCQSPDPAIFLLRVQSPEHIQIIPYRTIHKSQIGESCSPSTGRGSNYGAITSLSSRGWVVHSHKQHSRLISQTQGWTKWASQKTVFSRAVKTPIGIPIFHTTEPAPLPIPTSC